MTALERLKSFIGNGFPVISHARYGDGIDIGRPPENTLLAFQRAIAEGADVIEADIQVGLDGEFVIIHDGDVERTTGGRDRGRIEHMTLAEIKRFSACCGRPEFSKERIPTLAELAKIVPDNVGLLLEIKSDRFLQEGIAEKFVAELNELGIIERTACVSFLGKRLKAIKKVDPMIPIGWITYKPWAPLHWWPKKEVEMLGPAWFIVILNPLFVRLAHWRGQVVCPLDPKPDKRLWLYRLLRCDAVLTNDPAKTRQKLHRNTSP